MKKQLLLATLAIAISFGACKKKSQPGEDDPFELKYSNNTVEQNKKELEASGTAFVKEFNTLPDESFIKVLETFANLNFDAVDVDAIGLNAVLDVKVAAANKNVKMLLAKGQTTTGDVAKVSEVYGIYTWNKSKEEFTKTPSPNKIEFLFPSTEGGASNNATLSITYEAGTIATIDNEKIELPKKTGIVLTVNGKQEMAWNTTNDFDTDGTPKKINMVMTLGSFVLTSDLQNTGSNVSFSYSLKKGSKSLLNVVASADGKANINAIADEEDDLVKNANLTIEVMDFKFTGKANVKAIIDEIDAINEPSDEASVNKEAAIFNKYAQLVVVNSKDNSIIAKVEMKGKVFQNCYTYAEWDGQKYVNREHCYTDRNLEPELVFKDGSRQTTEDYTNSGFSAVIDEFEKLIDRF